MEPTTKRTRGGSRKPLIATESVLQPEHTDTVANLAAVLDNPEGKRMAQSIAALQGDIKAATSRVADLAKEKTTLEGLLSTSRAEAEQYSSLLTKISNTLGARCKVEEMPDAAADLVQRCNQYGEKADRMGAANAKLQAEHDEAQASLTQKAEALERQDAEIQGLRNGNELLGGEVDALTIELGQAQSEIKSLRLGASITILLLVGGLLGSLYSWGGAPKQLTPGGELSQSLQGGAK